MANLRNSVLVPAKEANLRWRRRARIPSSRVARHSSRRMRIRHTLVTPICSKLILSAKLQGTEPDLLSGLVPLAYGRLAMAEEELGDPQAAPKAFDDARHALPKPFGN